VKLPAAEEAVACDGWRMRRRRSWEKGMALETFGACSRGKK